jgi:propionate CoA-transferase
LLCDQKITAAAAKNSGGVVIAQVKRIAANGSLLSREVAVPGPLVDCVVVVDEQDHDRLHPMSYEERYNPALTGMIKTPQDEIKRIPLDIRKIIARRAFFALKPDKIVNLGIGLPEGLASVASEEGMLEYITMSTEPGVFGGFPVSGRSFGPAINASALVEMNQMFDFYDGGGLNMCFLGAAQVSKRGDVNVSRMSKNRLTGPGGFIDISQSTRNICFMTPLTTKDLKICIPGDGTLKIEKEGSVKKFVSEVLEKTFSGDEAVRRGQKVFYVTDRAVFRRTAKHEVLELVEIAPGIDLVKDVLDQLDFTPVVSPDLMIMDPRIFKEATMNVKNELFGSIEERCRYHSGDHTMYLDLFGVTLNSKDDVKYFVDALRKTFRPLVRKKGKIDMVVNYDGFDLRKGLEDDYSKAVTSLEHDFYKTTKRFTGTTFRRAKLAKQLRMSEWDTDALYDEIDTNQDSQISLEQLRTAIRRMFQINLTPSQMNLFQRSPDDTTVDRETFGKAVVELLKDAN